MDIATAPTPPEEDDSAKDDCCGEPRVAIPASFELRYKYRMDPRAGLRPVSLCLKCKKTDLPGIGLLEEAESAVGRFHAPRTVPGKYGVAVSWNSLGLDHWGDVIAQYAIAEPIRPLDLKKLKDDAVKYNIMLGLLGFQGNKRYVDLVDYDGRTIRFPRDLIENKFMKYANHGAYAGWVATTLLTPIECWIHADENSPRFANQLREHYIGAYRGPNGLTNHLVISVTESGQVMNSYSIESTQNANNIRFGALAYVSYDPNVAIPTGVNPQLAPFLADE